MTSRSHPRLAWLFLSFAAHSRGDPSFPTSFSCLPTTSMSIPQGELVNETFRPPDIHVEIASPDQPAKRNRERLQFSTANGCPLGWLIDPERRTVEVFRADRISHVESPMMACWREILFSRVTGYPSQPCSAG